MELASFMKVPIPPLEDGENLSLKTQKVLNRQGNYIITHREYGDAGIEIFSLAEQDKFDLIVINSHGNSA
jgi:hypothetical protein